MKVGLFFGTFNPIHTGHLIIAHYMAEFTDLDKVWFVVSPQNPFKADKDILDEEQRLHLVELATEDDEQLKVCDEEFKLSKPSYTIQTLQHLNHNHSDKEFVVIMGSDTLKTLPDWKQGNEILENYPLYVYPRPSHPKIPLMDHPNVTNFEVPLLNISATFVRKALKKERNMRYFLPEPVNEYIQTHQLYSS